MLMDSPLNRAGLLQVYIHTERVLVCVSVFIDVDGLSPEQSWAPTGLHTQ